MSSNSEILQQYKDAVGELKSSLDLRHLHNVANIANFIRHRIVSLRSETPDEQFVLASIKASREALEAASKMSYFRPEMYMQDIEDMIAEAEGYVSEVLETVH